MKLQCVIVDDEKDAREGLSLLLQQDNDIEIVAICSNGIEAIKDINALDPDLVFLDIQMPEVNGFEVLNSIHTVPRGIIFVTAYDQFALKAFEVHALDYLLKPFSDDRFYEALENAKSKITTPPEEPENISETANRIIQQQKVQNNMLHCDDKERLVFKSDGRIYFLDFQDIMWVEAYDYYIKIHVADRFFLVRDSMKNVMAKLGNGFVRIHKSSIINLDYIMFIDKMPNSNDVQVVLQDGTPLKVSRSYKEDLIKRIS